jgi:hypothetical protein
MNAASSTTRSLLLLPTAFFFHLNLALMSFQVLPEPVMTAAVELTGGTDVPVIFIIKFYVFYIQKNSF